MQAARSLHDCGLPRRPDAQAITVLVGGASWFESPEPDSRFAPRDRAAAERVGLRPGGRRLPARTLTGAVETELDAKRPDVRIF